MQRLYRVVAVDAVIDFFIICMMTGASSNSKDDACIESQLSHSLATSFQSKILPAFVRCLAMRRACPTSRNVGLAAGGHCRLLLLPSDDVLIKMPIGLAKHCIDKVLAAHTWQR